MNMNPRLYFILSIGFIFANAIAAEAPEHGMEVSVFGSSFFAGDSGPTVGVGGSMSEALFSDTFDTGFGLNAHYYRQFHPTFRWQVGLLYQRWAGKYFEGGEFQPVTEFGAGGQFDDLTLTGVFGGLTAIARRDSKLQPYASMDLALVNIAELNVTVNGVSQPYWKNTYKDYIQLRAGVAYVASENVTVVLHAGISTLGTPDAVDIFSQGTAGSALNFGVGLSVPF
jgi:hypothetical protein